MTTLKHKLTIIHSRDRDSSRFKNCSHLLFEVTSHPLAFRTEAITHKPTLARLIVGLALTCRSYIEYRNVSFGLYSGLKEPLPE